VLRSEDETERARDATEWRLEARGHLAAALLLRDHWVAVPTADQPERDRVAFPAALLAGYAVELYAKARLIELGRGPDDWKRKGHDIPWLVKKTGLVLDADDQRLLEWSKKIVTWAGRYPNPKMSSRSVGERFPRDVASEYFPRLESICKRLASPSAEPPQQAK
jgi:hypothetical protein